MRRPPRSRLLILPLATVLTALVLAACGGGDDATATPSQPTATPGGDVTQIGVELKSFRFTPREFEFSVGETVEFDLVATDINHDFTVRDLDIKWALSRGEQKVERFTFNEAGTFRLICTVPGHEGAGMVGEVVVR